MSDLNDLLDDDANDSDLVRTLRKALKTANQSLKEKDDALTAYSKKERASSLADVLKEKGLSPKAAALYPADADTSAEAVDAWVSEYGELFGIVKQESTADAAAQAAAAGISSASAQAPAGNASFDISAIAAEIANAKSEAELTAIYEKAGLK